MIDRSFAALLLAGIALAPPVAARAQTAQPPLQDRWPEPAQQFEQRTPAPGSETPAEPPQTPQAQAPAAAPSADAPAAKPAPRRQKPPARQAKKPAVQPAAIACSGVFSRDSSHQTLSSTFEEKNVTFAEVEGGPDGSKLMASVLFPNDPKRRLEVLWQNEDARTDTFRIVITGRSTWVGPMGLRLGLPLAAVEKINGKPFKLRGFDQSNSAVVIDWQDGALASVPGGCNIGVFFAADPKAPQSARSEAAGQEFASSDDAIRALKPTVREILLGYSQ